MRGSKHQARCDQRTGAAPAKFVLYPAECAPGHLPAVHGAAGIILSDTWQDVARDGPWRILRESEGRAKKSEQEPAHCGHYTRLLA